MPEGICKLCGQKAILQQSHLLPSAAYRLLRGSVPGSEDPILGHWGDDGTVLLQTSKQIQDFVFCWDCEQRFNAGGENWVLTQLASGPASPLFDAVSGLLPIYNEPDFRIYSTAGLSEFDTGQITHFALGVFFKAAVHRWTVERRKLRLQFGRYLEPVRKYLLGTDGFPERTTLMFCLFPPSDLPKAISVPYRWNVNDCHTYAFCVVGLEFVLSLGKQIPDWHRNCCFVTAPNRPVIVTDHSQKQMRSRSIQIVQSGNVKGKLINKFSRKN
jgi:hypothetical protein